MNKISQVLIFMFFLVSGVNTSYAQPLFPPTHDLRSCAHHAPWGWPRGHIQDHTTICRSGHALFYDNQAKVAAWVMYVLMPEHVVSCGVRPTRFAPDPLLPTRGRAHPSDYARSGYDQGHLASNADQSWHPQVQEESFFLSNVAPQHASVNRQVWRELEQATRAWAYHMGPMHVTVGVVYAHSEHTIGFHQVTVPTHFYRVVTHVRSGRTWAFLAPNQPTNHNRIERIQTHVHHIQQLTNLQIPTPDNPRLIRDLPRVHMGEYRAQRNQSCARSR
jgi:endonuclease G, mitochondrial